MRPRTASDLAQNDGYLRIDFTGLPLRRDVKYNICAPGRTRTDTVRILSPLPLPLGYGGHRVAAQPNEAAQDAAADSKSCLGICSCPIDTTSRGKNSAAVQSASTRTFRFSVGTRDR